jgi:predicted dinucleotide-utilizing enzyme
MNKVGIGIIGCGNISSAYLKAMASFPILDIRGLADMNEQAAKARADEFGLQARSIDALLADPSVEIIVNLTIPKAHVEVGLRTPIRKNRWASISPKANALRTRQRQRACASGRLRTPSSAAGTRQRAG